MDFAYNLADNSFKSKVYNTPGLYTYTIPKGVTTVFILVVGSGGGGGGGFTRTAGSAGGGGGGGGTAALSRVIIPRIFLPDTLTVSVASGGKGGAPGTAGSAGSPSHVRFNPILNPTSYNSFVITASGGGLAGGGTSVAGGFAGNQGFSTFAAENIIASLGEWVNRIGINGGTGGFPTTTNLLYGGESIPFSAGRGGGGINAATPGTAQNGGGITGRGFVPDFAGGTLGTGGNPGGNGINGMFMMKPFVSLGGCGGGSSNEKSGGNGGNGAPGCGGGGGGAGTSPGGLGGIGGNGGDGLVIITCW
jgi:hypothetical protein